MTTNFTYRGDGLRDSRAVSGGATTTFTWDIAAGLPVVLDDGNQYVYGAGLASMKQGGNWYYYLADGLGSTMAVVDGILLHTNAASCDPVLSGIGVRWRHVWRTRRWLHAY